MRKHLLGFTLVLVTAFSGCSLQTVQVGRPAPEFRLADLQGKLVSLEQFKGKVVVLDFWATWCGPCRFSMPELEKIRHEYGSSLTVLAINLQEPLEQVREYVQSRGLTSTVLLDQDGRVGRAYRSDAIPMQVLIDKEGIVRHISYGLQAAAL